MQRHFSAKVIKSYRFLLQRKGELQSFEDAVHLAGAKIEYLQDENNWVDVKFERKFMSALRSLVKIDDLCYLAGKDGLEPDALGGPEYFLIKHIVPLKKVFAQIPAYFNVLNKLFTLQLVTADSSNFKYTLSLNEIGLSAEDRSLAIEAIPDMLESIRGYWERLPTLKGYPPAKVVWKNLPTNKHYQVEINVILDQTSNHSRSTIMQKTLELSFVTIAFLIPIFGLQIINLPKIFWPLIALLCFVLYKLAKRQTTSKLVYAERTFEKLDRQYQELYQTQKVLLRRIEESALVSKFTESLISIQDEQGLFQTVCKNLTNILGYDRVLIFKQNEDALVPVYGLGKDIEIFLKSKFALPIAIDSTDLTKLSVVYSRKEAVLIKDVASHLITLKDPVSRNFLLASKSKSFAAGTIFSEDKKFGMLVIDNLDSSRMLTDEDLNLLKVICRQVALFLDGLYHKQNALRIYQDTAQSYSRFVPWKILNLAGYKSVFDVKLGDSKEIDVTILFSDIRGFTALCELMKPYEVLAFINSYLDAISPIIEKNGGVIDKFIGDCVMAIFDKPENAVKASIEMWSQLLAYNVENRLGGRQIINAGFGLNSGKLVIGPVGYSNRMEITVVSDIVNTASRLDALNKDLGSDILLSETVFRSLPKELDANYRRMGKFEIRGRKTELNIYELLVNPKGIESGIASTAAEEAFVAGRLNRIIEKHTLRQEFENALSLYEIGEWKQAKSAFVALHEKMTFEDKVIDHYLQLIGGKLEKRVA
jgi:class 3 adenylate cyclase